MTTEFRYLQGLDSPGYDFGKVEHLDVAAMMRIAREDPKCVGFTDTGYFKFYIPSKSELQPAPSPGNGLYVAPERWCRSIQWEPSASLPKLAHFIWCYGGRSFDLVSYLAVKTFHVNNPGYRIVIHCDREPETGTYFERLKNNPAIEINSVKVEDTLNGHPFRFFQNKADYARLKILQEHGGIYLDLDVLTLKSFDRFIGKKVVMGLERENEFSLCNAVVAAPPHCPFISEWIEIYQDSWGDTELFPWWYGHSTVLPLRLSRKYSDLMSIQKKETFYPFLWDDFSILADHDNRETYSDSYAIHLWETELRKTDLAPTSIEYFSEHRNAMTRLFSKCLDQE